MDAHALLTSQGWRGTGHSLHPTSDSNGLSKPLLVSRKANTLGIGKKQHKTSDMWWMNAFDKSLKGLDTSVEGVVVQTMTSGGLDMVARGGGKYVGKSGLYASFVRGECLSGTLTPEEEKAEKVDREKGEGNAKLEAESAKEGGNKRKRDNEEKESRRAKKSALNKTEAVAEDFAVKAPNNESNTTTPEDTLETKEVRRARKAARRAAKEQAAVVEIPQPIEIIETKDERRERRRLKRLAEAEAEKEREGETIRAAITETKEQRKERRRLKKLALVDERTGSEEKLEKEKKKKKKQKD